MVLPRPCSFDKISPAVVAPPVQSSHHGQNFLSHPAFVQNRKGISISFLEPASNQLTHYKLYDIMAGEPSDKAPAPPAEQLENLQLDEVTGEKVCLLKNALPLLF